MNTPCLSTRVLTDLDGLEQLSSDWNDLWNRCPTATSFQRHEWVLSWTRAFRPRQLFVIEVRRGNALAGIAPLFLYHAAQERVLAPLAASVSDYLDFLIEPDHALNVLAVIFKTLQGAASLWDRLDITDLPSWSPLLRMGFEDWELQRSEETVCPVLAIPARAKSVEELLPAKLRHNLRTARHRSVKAGSLQIDTANASTLDETLAAMMRLHGARWTDCGDPGVLASPEVQTFHHLAAPALLRRGVLRLYGMRLNGSLIATLYALCERSTVYCYLQGFDPSYSPFSPGVQILAAVIDDAIRSSVSAVDFLRGREAYKYSWGARDQQTYRICLRRRTQAERASSPCLAA